MARAIIENLLNTILVWPRPDDLVALSQIIDANGTYYFPGIVGMLDGWHILISGQGTDCDRFYNRKHFLECGVSGCV